MSFFTGDDNWVLLSRPVNGSSGWVQQHAASEETCRRAMEMLAPQTSTEIYALAQIMVTARPTNQTVWESKLGEKCKGEA